MGKGDKRSFKGKVFRHSYGKTRLRRRRKGAPGGGAATAGRKK